jgi:hypothetical protein
LAAGGRADGRRAGRPAAARQRVAGSACACSAVRDERSGARRAPRASRYCDGPCRHPPASRAHCPRSSDRRTVALARSATVASLGGARIQQRLLGGRLGRRRPQPSWRSSVGHLAEHFLRARPRRDIALCHRPRRLSAASIGVERGGGAAVQRGVGRFAAARDRRATPGRWRTPGRPAWRSRTFEWARNRAKVAVLSPGWKPVTQEWGRFRTVNWTPNPENRPQRERKAAARRA